MAMWAVWLIVSVLLYILHRLIKFWLFDPWSIHRQLWAQGIPGHYIPIVGDMLRLRETLVVGDPFSYTDALVAKYGHYYHTSFGPFATLNISDPALIDGVLKTNARSYHKAFATELLVSALLGHDNLLVAEGEQHARHRRLIAPTFQHKNINSMVSLMVKTTARLLDRWADAAAQNRSKDQIMTMDIHEQMAHLTLDIVTGCVFGAEIAKDNRAHDVISRNLTSALNEAENRIFSMVALIPVLNRLPLPSKRRLDKAKQDIRNVVRDIIEQRKLGFTKSACQGLSSHSCSPDPSNFRFSIGPDLLDLLLAASGENQTQKLTDEEVFDEALTFGK